MKRNSRHTCHARVDTGLADRFGETPAYAGTTNLAVIPAQAGIHYRIIDEPRPQSPSGFAPNPRRGLKWIPAFAGMTYFFLAGEAIGYDLRGHAKAQVTSINLPADSLLEDFADDPLTDSGVDLRFNYGDRRGGFNWRADYQLLALRGDRTELSRQTGLTGISGNTTPDDERRLFDLTHRISEDDDRVTSHRLDRLYLGHTSDKTVISFGRQAVSWGNGLVYNPVDFFNPFDPAAIDTEYKTGDDLLYTQYLFDSGNDLQAAWVLRRDDGGDVVSEVSSLAFKYHGFAGGGEYDLLLAEHFDETVAAVGGALDYAEAVWRADIMVVDSADEVIASAVLNWSYSWIAWDKNLSANIELYRNGFGIDDGDYGPPALADNPELVERLRRGELFTLGKNYFAAAATIELAPLWIVTATLFENLDDRSRLLQLVSRHDLQQDLQALIALNLPAGEDGSEFGGIDSAVPGKTLGVGESLFAQLAWYF